MWSLIEAGSRLATEGMHLGVALVSIAVAIGKRSAALRFPKIPWFQVWLVSRIVEVESFSLVKLWAIESKP